MFRLLRLSIIIIAILLAIASCSRRATDTRLLHAEAIIEEHPDSSLLILDAIDSAALATPADHALYALLIIQARYKNFIEETDPTLIRAASDYYATTDDAHRYMLSKYYLGCVLHQGNNFADAIISLLDSENIAEQLEDYKYLGMIRREISDIYGNIYCAKDRLHYAKSAFNAFLNYPDSSYAHYSLNDLGYAYCNDFQGEKSLDIAQKTKDISLAQNDSILLNRSIRLQALSYFCLNKFDSAAVAFEKIETITELDSLDFIKYVVSVTLSNDKHKIDSLKTVFNNNGIHNESLPHEFLVASGADYKTAYKSLHSRSMMDDNYVDILLGQNVTRAVDNYKTSEKEKAQQDLKNTQNRIVLIVFIFVILMIIIGLLYRIRLITIKKREENLISEAEKLNCELKKGAHTNEHLNAMITQLITQRFETISQLCDTYYENSMGPKAQRRIFEEVKNQITELTCTELAPAKLEKFIDTYTDGMIAELRKEYPELSNTEITLFMYIVAGFSTKAICALIDEKPEVVYNRKARLKGRLKNSNRPSAESFLNYF